MPKAHAPLPVARVPAAPARRVLVIDDDPKILRICERLFSHHAFVVTTVRDSTQVVSLLRAQPFDVTLLDVKMPGLEGTDLLPLLKKIKPDMPVILVTAYSDEASVAYYHSLGAFAVVGKPFNHEVLQDTVDRALDTQERIPITLTTFSLREGRDQLYRKLILGALRKTQWNQVKAAELLGVSRYCLIRWIKKLGISY